ncbi:hypothetical protein IV203_011558 [Nitzschia inconspicua]|uniref:Uncharacterized protein n=1 Tax=Nitzschia inconspicua TaxID=303405 RepID=A0A9K3KSZ7_9STRA|nr:hypothetical protein IV203_011558 [Nitzschia inconspicua]
MPSKMMVMLLQRSLVVRNNRNADGTRGKELGGMLLFVLVLSMVRFSRLTDHWLRRYERFETDVLQHGQQQQHPSIHSGWKQQKKTATPIPFHHNSDTETTTVSSSSRLTVPFRQSTLNVTKNVNIPYFILHVGPPKTATTFLQCGLNHQSGRLANEDNYYFLGRSCPTTPAIMDNGEDPIKPLYFIKSLGLGQQLNETFVQETRRRFLHHQRLGHHLILSTEHISSKAMHQISQPMIWQRLLEGFQVKIVVGYRHYFEWFPSYYYQSHLHKKFRANWPSQGGETIPPLVEYMKQHLDRWESPNRDETDRFATHMSLLMYQNWSLYFDDVQVLDLHQTGNVLVNFICHILPSATNTCDYLKHLQAQDADENALIRTKRVSSNLFPERIADTAWQLGMVPNDNVRSKKHVTTMIKGYLKELRLLQNGSMEQYWWCPSVSLKDRIYQASLSFLQSLHEIPSARQNMFAGHNWTLAVQQHREQFQKALRQHKFCDVNTTHILLQNKKFTSHVFGSRS